MSEKKLFIQNTFYNAFFNVFSQIINLLILPLFIKNLGTELYGIWVLATIIVGYLGLLNFGFGVGIQKYLSKSYNQKDFSKFNEYISTGVVIYFIVGLLIFISIVLFSTNIVSFFNISSSNYNIAKSLLQISGFYSLIYWPMTMLDSVFPAILNYKVSSILKGIQISGSSIGLLILVFFSNDIITIAIYDKVIRLFLWIPTLFVIVRIIPFFSLRLKSVRISILKEIYKFSFAMFYMQLLGYLAYQKDSILIGKFMGLKDITNYSISIRMNQMLDRGLNLLTSVIMPTMFKAEATQNKSVIENMVNKGTRYYAIISTPLAFMSIVIIEPFIRLWVGNEFVQYAIWAIVFLSGYIIDPAMNIVSTVIFSLGHHKIITIVRTISTSLNILLSIYLIQYIGIGGPILATILIGSFLNIPTYPYFCKLININWKDSFYTMYKIVMINIPSFVFLYILFNFMIVINNWFILAIAILFSLIIFYSPLIYFNLENDEKQYVNHILSKFIGRDVSIFK